MTKELLSYFNGDELAASTWLSKYAAKEEITPDDMHKRMAKEFHRVLGSRIVPYSDKLSDYGQKRLNLSEEAIYGMFKDFKYIIPQGSVMSTLGTDTTASLSNCLAGETKVLTRDGYKEIQELSGKNVEIMTKGGGWVKAPFKSFGTQALFEVTLIKGKTGKKTIRCTIDHDWFTTNGYKPTKKRTSDLKAGDRLHSQYGKSYNAYILSSSGIAHGITFGDGHTVIGENNCNNITLCAESRALKTYFPHSYVSSDEGNCEGGSDFYSGLPNFFRELPNIRENKSYLYGWLAGYFATDGCMSKNDSPKISSAVKNNLKFVQDVCGILGISCGEICAQNRLSNLTNKYSIIYTVHLSNFFLREEFFLLDKHKKNYKESTKKPPTWKVDSVTNIDVMAEVFCGVVPETHSFTIDNNILSGNCWVIPEPFDSYSGIMFTDTELTTLYKRRGGVGTGLSGLRPKGTTTRNTAKTTTGAISFAHRFSNTTREVAMNGRRGALMLTLDIRHPDSLDFIKSKRDDTSLTGANISLKLNQGFKKAVEADGDYFLQYPVDADISGYTDRDSMEYGVLEEHGFVDKIGNPEYTVWIKKIKAKEYWDEIIESAKNWAEPGLIYFDNVLNYDPASVYTRYKPTNSNPCGEQFLNPYDSCRLLALNLFNFVLFPFTDKAAIDSELLYKMAYEHMILGDALVDLEQEYIQRIIDKIKSDPEPAYIKKAELDLWIKAKDNIGAGRRVGLGITALADMLAAIGVGYASDEGKKIIEEVMKIKMEAELDATIDLSILYGSFEGYDFNLEYPNEETSTEDKGGNDFYTFLLLEFHEQFQRMKKYGRRSLNWSTLAPTGTVSMMTRTSSGMEPIFLPMYKRRKKINISEDIKVDFVDNSGDSWQEFQVLHPKFKLWVIYTLNRDLGKGLYDIDTLTEETLISLFEKSPWFGSTANDLDWKDRVDIQAILQKYTTNAISSTINLPKTVTNQEVSDIYMYGWGEGLKGQTVYVEGSRSGVLVSNKKGESKSFTQHHAPKRPKKLPAEVHHVTSLGERFTVIVGLFDDKPYEVFCLGGEQCKHSATGLLYKKSRGNYEFERETGTCNLDFNIKDEEVALTRIISTALRHGTEIRFIVQQLNKADGTIVSFSKAIARTLKKYIVEGEKVSGVTCDDCGSTDIIFEEGCSKCTNCGSSKCG